MRNWGGYLAVSLLLFLIVFGSCSKFRKVQKSENWEVKYEAAVAYYEKEDYFRASILFEEIMPLIRGQREGELVQYYYAYCNYYQKQYQLAAYYFESFYQTYGRSEYAEEAEFMRAYSLYRDSPVFNLDQTSTREALEAMQLFINRNVTSKYLAEADAIIGEMQRKLEKKSYENAKQYFKRQLYHAAILAFNNFAIDYPDSDFNAELSFLKFKAQYEIAELSIPSLRQERYEEAITLYQEFLEDFPNDRNHREADALYNNIVGELNKLNRNQRNETKVTQSYHGSTVKYYNQRYG